MRTLTRDVEAALDLTIGQLVQELGAVRLVPIYTRGRKRGSSN